MYIQSLLLTIKGLSPEGKYLLVQLIRCFDIHNTIDSSAVQLAKLCGVSRKVIVPSMTILSEAGLISITNKGKVKKAYQFSSGFVEALEATKKYRQPLSYSKALIDELLDSNCDKHDSLNVSHKLLLSLLLAHADSFGIVHDFSIADISKFTGMKRERIRTQIRKLTDLKYIIYRISGINHDFMFGKKKGAFYLEIKDKFQVSTYLCNREEKLVRVINDDNFYNIEYLIHDLLIINNSKVMKYKHHHCNHGLLDNLWFKTLAKMLSAENLNEKSVSYFQYALEQYVCHMLSKYVNNRRLFIEGREKIKIRKLKSLLLTSKVYRVTDVFDDEGIDIDIDIDIDILVECVSTLVSNLYLGLVDDECCKGGDENFTYQIKILSNKTKVLSRCVNR
jgi:hypothetical protein